LDQEFSSDPDNLTDLLFDYVRPHQRVSGPDCDRPPAQEATGRQAGRRLSGKDVSVTEMSAGPDIIEAHTGSSNHREMVLAAERCGCFYCCAEFEPGAITDWVDPASDDMQAGTTALCPRCGIDAVIPRGPGMDARFLQRMKVHWF
jgi:hypothetical protein